LIVLILVAYLSWANQPLPLPPNVHSTPSPNGFETATDAVARLTRAPDGSPLVDRTYTNARVLREKLAPEKAGLDLLRKSLAQEWSTPLVQDFTQEFPYLAQFRDGARKFAAESRLALAEGRAGDAAERALDAIELGSRSGQEGTVIHHLAGLSMSAIGTDQAERVARSLSAAEARRAGARLDRIIARFPEAEAALEEERWICLNTLRRLFAGELDLRAISGGTPSRSPSGNPPWFLYPKPWSYRNMDQGFRAYMVEAKKPYPERRPVPPPRELLSRILLPTMGRALLAFEKNRAALGILRLELALEQYRKTRGRYPTRLEELAPEILPSLPVDPYSMRSFVYRPQGDRYALYSVGPDGKDDAGKSVEGDLTQPGVTGDLVAGQLSPRRRASSGRP
jgi:hypothetical protein